MKILLVIEYIAVSYRYWLPYYRQKSVFPLEKVKSMVDLGVRFDNNLIFRDHISGKKSTKLTMS